MKRQDQRLGHITSSRHERRSPSTWEVAKHLAMAYPDSDLGNRANPLDELAFIILSGQTEASLAKTTYLGFKRQFPRWDDVANARLRSLEASIHGGGLGHQKARYLREIARLTKADFGRATLAPLRRMSTTQAELYLCGLPGVGVKSARCVLLYSLQRDVFPADVHCLRVMTRLGWIGWHGERGEELADPSQQKIPPSLRRLLHVKLVQHGRAVCRSRPNCPSCVLNRCCPSADNARYSDLNAERQK